MPTLLSIWRRAIVRSPFVIAAIRLLVFTSARLSEILTLRWEYVNLEHKALWLPDSKTGRKTIYLSSPALAVLERLPRISGNPYVIPGKRDGGYLVNLQKPTRAKGFFAGLMAIA